MIPAVQLDLERYKRPSLHYLVISSVVWWLGRVGVEGFSITSNNANCVSLVLLKVSDQFKLKMLLEISNWQKITVKTDRI